MYRVAQLASIALLGYVADAAPAAALITSLPGLAAFPSFPMYSGYVQVDSVSDRNLFYWHVTAATSTPDTPHVLWLTGGPGCSSLYALTTEHGFALSDPANASQLLPNPYSWNKAAHITYLESPSGVGFSFSGNGNYTTGDAAVAQDNYNFLVGYIQQFPEYVGKPFYLAGESYAGHYVPQLAALLVAKPIPGLQFTGFLVGNPSFDGFYDGNDYWTFMAYHGLISNQQYQAAFQACNGSFVGAKPPACSTMLESFLPLLVGIDPYNIYAPCNGPVLVNGGCLTTATLAAEHMRSVEEGAAFQPSHTNLAQTIVPCTNVSGPVFYFNLPSVRQALHVDDRAHGWDVCSTYVNYTQYASSVRDIYLSVKDELDILVYSGDVDSCVPYLGTEAAMDSLQFPVSMPYAQWTVNDTNNFPQIAGYYRTYVTAKNMTYATVKGSGHMCPTFKPLQSFALFSRFIQRQPPN